jgi:AMP phosphorylase
LNRLSLSIEPDILFRMIYLRPKKLDILGDKTSLEVYLNRETADHSGVREGDLLDLSFLNLETGAIAVVTDTLVGTDEIGLPASLWTSYKVSTYELIAVEVQGQAKSVQFIRKKILGHKLNYEEIRQIMFDIAKKRLSPVEMTYFASASYSPGFDEEEMHDLTKAMAETGLIMNFKGVGEYVVDKHSIGGLPSKGITPVLVSLIASVGLIIPNTSTRAITSPAGTSDIMETMMPIALEEHEIMEVVKKTNGCIVWGGGLDLAPADDILIQIERPLHVESYDKFIVSITAKKIATGITHLLLDVPYGEGTKVPDKDVPIVAGAFEKLCAKFGMKIHVYKRLAKGPDGNGIGPILESRDVLWILERDKRRPVGLENLALDMSARLMELTGKWTYEGAFKELRHHLESGKALDKFWEIGKAQGATEIIKGDDLQPGNFTFDVKAQKTGLIDRYDNHHIVSITKALGAPYVKKAGIFVHRQPGERVSEGDVIATLYAESQNRLQLAEKIAHEVRESWVRIV